MSCKRSKTTGKSGSRGAAMITTNAKVRSEMARIYRSYNAGEISMDEMNKRVSVLDKIRLTLVDSPKPKSEDFTAKNEELTIREKLIANRIERGLNSRINQLLAQLY